MSEAALKTSGVFAPGPVGALWKKCLTRANDDQFSNTDNMAVVGILSTQLVHQQLVREAPSTKRPPFKTVVVKLS